MKNFLIIAVSTIILFVAGMLIDQSTTPGTMSANNDSDSPALEMDLPMFEFTDVSGKPHQISDFTGKIVILNFWASWCGPCVEEFPAILEIVSKYPNDVVLVAISNDKTLKDITKFMKKLKIKNGKEFNTYIGHDKYGEIATNIFNVLRLPETFIINKKGKIIRKVVGAKDWLSKDVLKFIKDLLESEK